MDKESVMRIIPATAIRMFILFFVSFPVNLWGQGGEPDYGSFPFRESFMNGQPEGVLKAPVADGVKMTNSAVFTNQGVNLTPNQQRSFGAIFIDNRRFRSYNGIIIEFEYIAFGGTGGDGISMFLFDDQPANPTIGANGAGLGYSYNRSYIGWVDNKNFAEYRMPGLSGGYLGVAFDAFGNFKSMRYQGESRVNGIPFSQVASGSFTRDTVNMERNDDFPNQVTLRGARGPTYNYRGTEEPGYSGYPVLISQSTFESEKGYILDETGKYIRHNAYNGPRFPINGGEDFIDDTSPGYRKAIIELYPHYLLGGFTITVKIKHGQTTSVIINDYHYSTSLKYPENAFSSSSSGDINGAEDVSRTPSYIGTLNASVPDYLKIGFAASTGRNTNYHIIKNVEITLPGAAIANNDFEEIDQGQTAMLFPLLNDLGFTGEINKGQQGSPDYLDETTFRFINDAGEPTLEPYRCVTKEGTWVYNPTTKEVTFTPYTNLFNGEAIIHYDIKAGKNNEIPYFHEAYRSLPAIITVNVRPNPVTLRNTISNKMITVKVR